jgi:DNA invertase Pin-like site-specific DNA recombinase
MFAEHEREQISQRNKAALQAARARGVVLGNPELAEVRPLGWEANRAAADRFWKCKNNTVVDDGSHEDQRT